MEIKVADLRFKRFFEVFFLPLCWKSNKSLLWFHILPRNDLEVINEKGKAVEVYNISNNLQVYLNILYGIFFFVCSFLPINTKFEENLFYLELNGHLE